MKKILVLCFLSLFLILPPLSAYAASSNGKIPTPSFVNEVDSGSIEKAGNEISGWILLFMAVIIALFSVRPGYYFFTGKAAEGWEYSKDILIGAVISSVLGGLAFAVIGAVS